MSDYQPVGVITAHQIYDILVAEVGAPEGQRADFVWHATNEGITEYRFQGNLGFGGKVYYHPHYTDHQKWRVTCYREDETPGREVLMRLANDKLKGFD